MNRRSFVKMGTAATFATSSPLFSEERNSREVPARPSSLVSEQIEWDYFLSRHDLVWDSLPAVWGESPFLGNGRLALSLTTDADNPGALVFCVDHTDIYDRRDLRWGWTAYSQSRYHPGDFLLHPSGDITDVQMRLILYNGELAGTITTTRGTIAFTVFVHPERMIAAFDVRTSGAEDACRWEWRPGKAVSSRKPIRTTEDQAIYEKSYGHAAAIWVDNPPADISEREGTTVCTQKLLAGGAYATAWSQVITSSHHRTMYASCVMSYPAASSPGEALAEIRYARADGLASLRAANQRWWHAYYPASFLSIPDAQFESFYWIQMYKYGCAAPKQAGVIDTHGPWLQPTLWPYITWNLNTQISYWALQPANRLALAEPLFRTLDKNLDTLRKNADTYATQADTAALGHCSQQDLDASLNMDVRFEREWGNLLWICHNYWLQCRFSMDETVMRNHLFPLLRSAVNFYLPALEEHADGTLHLPMTFSPEIGSTRDCNYDLALLRWACEALVEICRRTGQPESLLSRWQSIVARLAAYPEDENGLRVGLDLAVSPHRHFSHLLMIYPLYLVNWDDHAARPLITKSVEHWYSPGSPHKSDAGFTLAVGASFYASMMRGEEALACLDTLLKGTTGIGKIMPNTMYAESGQNMETPLAAAQSFHDMLLQSWGNQIRVFPAVPRRWRDAIFHNLRAQGAFLVSACLQNGAVRWVRIKSLHEEPCVVQCSFPSQPRGFTQDGEYQLPAIQNGCYHLDLKRGSEILLTCDSNRGGAAIKRIQDQSGASNFYGVHAKSAQRSSRG